MYSYGERNENSEWERCVAVCNSPGMSDVVSLTTLGEEPRLLTQCWDFWLQLSDGSFIVLSEEETEQLYPPTCSSKKEE